MIPSISGLPWGSRADGARNINQNNSFIENLANEELILKSVFEQT